MTRMSGFLMRRQGEKETRRTRVGCKKGKSYLNSAMSEMLYQTLATVMELKTPIKQAQWNQPINFY